MATRKVASRLSSRLQSLAPKLNRKSISSSKLSPPDFTSQSQFSTPTTTRRISSLSRLPVELGAALETMKPLHSAIASARLRSSLSIESQSWCLVPQGVSMPL